MEKLDYTKVYILPIGEVLERREKGERPFADIWEGAVDGAPLYLKIKAHEKIQSFGIGFFCVFVLH